MQTRRTILTTAVAAAGTMVLPFRAAADGHQGDVFDTPIGEVTIHPIAHATFMMDTPLGRILVDPVGDMSLYDGLPEPDLILITHEHGDHYSAGTLQAARSTNPSIITNPAVFGMLDDTNNVTALANGETSMWDEVSIHAIPAYNTTEGRLNFHPQGRDNGYVVDLGGFVVYISGDTEDIPEMRALEGIDLAFVCMNLPFTMDNVAAADAVAEFRPRYVYPYHYRGRDGAFQDTGEFSEMLADSPEIELRFGDWYG